MEYLAALLSPQTITIAILVISLGMFIKDRLRYDLVALMILIAIIAFQILPPEEVFSYFGHPALVIVASMFVMGRALVQSGIIDVVTRRLDFLHTRPIGALAVLVMIVTTLSAFINNVGALAIVIPIALHLAHKSKTPVSLFLLPLAFASHLGGYLTLIGTPRNIIISSFREDAIGIPYQMLDFAWVGGGIMLAGLIFLVTIAWRIIPTQRTPSDSEESTNRYTTEAEVTEHSDLIGIQALHFTEPTQEQEAEQVMITHLFRNGRPIPLDKHDLKLLADDIVMLEGTAEALTQFTEEHALMLTGLRAEEKNVTSADEQTTLEAVVTPYSKVSGMTWDAIPLPQRFGTNFIGLSREHELPAKPLSTIPLRAGDIVLLQGRTESVRATADTFSFLPLAAREVTLGRTRTIITTLSIIAGAIGFASFSGLPIAPIFLTAAVLLLALNLLSLRQAYESIDWPVLVLLAGMLALGSAISASGAADMLAHSLLQLQDILGPITLLAIILITSMVLSDFMNTTASTVIMAPIAIVLAQNIGVSIDPFLMAVAIGASSAFLTPIGHESNTLVMQKGGYRFSDFMRVGLPLEIILIIVALPLLLIMWPL